MSAHVLLNLFSEFGKRDKMHGLLGILWLFRSEFNKFCNKGALMLGSIHHMTLKLLLMKYLRENANIWPYLHDVITGVIT